MKQNDHDDLAQFILAESEPTEAPGFAAQNLAKNRIRDQGLHDETEGNGQQRDRNELALDGDDGGRILTVHCVHDILKAGSAGGNRQVHGDPATNERKQSPE